VYPANNISVTSGSRRGALLLCALLMLISQLFFQLHSIDHLSDTDHESCEICLAGGALDHGLASTVHDDYVKFDGKVALPGPVINAYAMSPLSCHPRAPPLSNTSV